MRKLPTDGGAVVLGLLDELASEELTQCMADVSDALQAAYEIARRIDSGDQVVVGLNRFALDEDVQPQLQRIDESVRDEQIARTAAVRAARDEAAVRDALAQVALAAAGDANLMPPMREALRLRATLQEVCDVLRSEFGSHIPSETF
jgi:methylmalonyl-CoA mutase N-terminal domain/subunit